MRQKVANDRLVAELATRQHGVISTQQLLAAGLAPGGISRPVRAGRLHRIHQGVYAVGHRRISVQGRWMAAILASGTLMPASVERRDEMPPGAERGGGIAAGAERRDGMRGVEVTVKLDLNSSRTILDCWGAALSHRSAASLWNLLPPDEGPVDVSIPRDVGKAKRQGIRLHRSLNLIPAAVVLRSGIPVTTPARTILDLRRAVSMGTRRGLVSAKELRRAIRQANVFGLPISDEVGRDRSRSDLERDFLKLCQRHRLPLPEVNVGIGRHLVDFIWPERRLVVETDGYAYHRGRQAFEDDRARDLELRAQGFEVLRLSEKQIDVEPKRVAEVLAAALRVGADG
jgi:very-short-patch-repair endonuclease/predicted transcriptional regulator of viral defense system